MASKSYISFYDSINEIPVSQDTSDSTAHYNRRRALYQDLGLPQALLCNAKILEFGPGSGDNATYLNTLSPPLLHLVDGAKPSVQALNAKKQEGSLSEATVFYSSIEDFSDDLRYDVVLCEGLLPGQAKPDEILSKVSSHVNVQGVLVITTCCHVSLFSEVLRRCLLPLLQKRADQLEQDVVEFATEFFAPHLSTLVHASRYPRDWVLDCIIQPWVERYEYSLIDVLDCIGEDFEFYASSPKFLTDWRWYKSKEEGMNGMNGLAKKQFQETRSSYVNTKSGTQPQSFESGQLLSDFCNRIYHIHNQIRGRKGPSYSIYESLLAELNQLLSSGLLDGYSQSAVEDYCNVLQQMLVDNWSVNFEQFSGFWGRGQSYISLIRKSGS